MKAPDEEKGFQTDEAGILTDLEEALWLIHELSCTLYEITADPRVRLFLGAELAMPSLMAVAGHNVSCDKKGDVGQEENAEPEKPVKREDKALPGFLLPPDLLEKLREL